MSKTWDDRINDYIKEISHDFPNPGQFISALLEEFFPEGESDIFSIISDRSKNLFKPGMIEKEIKNRNSNFKKLLQNLLLYRDDYENENSEYYINNLIDQCNNLYKNFINNSNVSQLIPINITFSLIHLTILKERKQFGFVICGNWDQTWETEL